MSDLLQIMQKYKESKIALYGLGIETEKILTRFGSQFHITGLLDSYRKDGIMYGMRIISLQEAVESGVSLILVVARPGSCRAIAKKISQTCANHQIELIDVRGRDLCNTHTVCYDLKNLQGITKNQFIKLARSVRALSVDLFDTLIMRNTLFYTDIFDIMDSRLKNKGIYFTDFAKKRLDAEKSLAVSGAPTLENIYSYMNEKYGLEGIDADSLAVIEWEIDFELVVPRQELCELINQQYQQGKLIYIVSDSYYNRERIEKLLEKCGIFYTDVLISCEHNMGKTQGLFKKLKKKLEEKTCLHIGDDYVADVEAAINNGIEAYRIYSGLDLFEATGYLGTWDQIVCLSDRIRAGMFVAKLFNSPFQFETIDKRIGIENAFDIGYLLFAPMITDFVLWFQKQIEHYGLQNVWFCARDGYLIKQLYDELAGNDKSEYFLTSRIAVVRAGIENDQDISYVASMKFAGSLSEQLEERFGIALQKESSSGMEDKQLLDYRCEILDNTLLYRRNYQSYISRLNIDDHDIAFFDFVAKGTCQFFVQKLLPNHLKGLYFLQLEKENIEEKGLDIVPFYSTKELENSAIYENYYILETVLTSDQPSVIGFNTQGRAVFAEETRSSRDIECSEFVQKGIRSFFHTYLSLCPEEERCENKKLDEIILELIHGIEIRDDAFKGMKVEDQFFRRFTEIGDLL